MSLQEIAVVAAQLVVEEGLEYGPAKHRALHRLGLPPRTRLPGNDAVEDAVREHIQLFCADSQPVELLSLRRLALDWMQRLADFRPHLSGSVWHGTATRLSDIYLQLFCDDPKSAEIALIDKGVRFKTASLNGMHGNLVSVLSIQEHSPELNESVGIHLMIYDLDDIRGALRPNSKERVPRGNLDAVSAILRSKIK
jgi:hypothetical protein